jgi:hypothetical protein
MLCMPWLQLCPRQTLPGIGVTAEIKNIHIVFVFNLSICLQEDSKIVQKEEDYSSLTVEKGGGGQNWVIAS